MNRYALVTFQDGMLTLFSIADYFVLNCETSSRTAFFFHVGWQMLPEMNVLFECLASGRQEYRYTVIQPGGDGALSDADRKCFCPKSWCVVSPIIQSVHVRYPS
jgi:hypothetical protein